jgi:hypothetical protein
MRTGSRRGVAPCAWTETGRNQQVLDRGPQASPVASAFATAHGREPASWVLAGGATHEPARVQGRPRARFALLTGVVSQQRPPLPDRPRDSNRAPAASDANTLGCRISLRPRPFVVGFYNGLPIGVRRRRGIGSQARRSASRRRACWGFLQRPRLMRQRVSRTSKESHVGGASRGGAVQEMEDCWPSGVGCLGAGAKPPCAALAEDRRGERQGKGAGLIASGGDREDVPEAPGRWLGVRC